MLMLHASPFFILLRTANEQTDSIAGSKADDDWAEPHAATAPPPVLTPLLLTPCLVGAQLPKSCYSICHIECLRPVHGALNVDEKKN